VAHLCERELSLLRWAKLDGFRVCLLSLLVAGQFDESWGETANRTIRALYRREPEPGEVDEWIGFMKILLKGVQCGEQYVCLDGYVIPVTADGVTIEGWHSYHDFDFVPQVAALTDSRVRDDLLCSREYWQANRVERQDE